MSKSARRFRWVLAFVALMVVGFGLRVIERRLGLKADGLLFFMGSVLLAGFFRDDETGRKAPISFKNRHILFYLLIPGIALLQVVIVWIENGHVPWPGVGYLLGALAVACILGAILVSAILPDDPFGDSSRESAG